MDFKEDYNKYLTDNGGIYFPGIVDDETKSDNFLTPIFETITNALEAIKPKNTNKNYNKDDTLTISIYFKEKDSSLQLDHIDIQDTGIGFNKKTILCVYNI